MSEQTHVCAVVLQFRSTLTVIIKHYCFLSCFFFLLSFFFLFFCVRSWNYWRLFSGQSQRLQTLGTFAVPVACAQFSVGRTGADCCGRIWLPWRRTLASSTRSSYAWTSPRKSCWKKESKRSLSRWKQYMHETDQNSTNEIKSNAF